MTALLVALATTLFLIASSALCGEGYLEPAEVPYTASPRPTVRPTYTPYPSVEPTVTVPPPEAFTRTELQERRTTAAIHSGRAMGREEAVGLALELLGETYGQEVLGGYMRRLWGGVVDQREAQAITGGAHAYRSVDERIPVWVLVLEGPVVYQFQHPLRLYTAVVMSADTGAQRYLYQLGAPPTPIDVWRLENLWEYLPSALAQDR